MDASKEVRIQAFLDRLKDASPASSAEEAYALVCETLNEVEDEFTSIPFDIAAASDKRMYPPLNDNAFKDKECPGVTRYRSRGHNTRVGANGAIRIDEVKGSCLLDKAGKSGEKVQMPPKR
jgi:hypothetical protein